MKSPKQRIAIHIGTGYVSGLSAVITGAVLAAHELGWEVVGIRDGFDGLLFPERYPDGGLVALTPQNAGNPDGDAATLLGTGARSDPFHVRRVNADNLVEEADGSGELLERIRAEQIAAVISVVGTRTLGILFKLCRRGLMAVCVPESVENDVAATMLSFGFNSALGSTVEILDRARQAALSARRIGVVEVLGEHTGWLALQSSIAVCADAALIPEIPYDLSKVAAKLRAKAQAGQPWGLVVAAEGAVPREGHESGAGWRASDPLRASLSPGATGEDSPYVIERSGCVAQAVALQLQRLTDQETHPLVLGALVKGGAPTAVDRQLGIGYGAGAVRALKNNRSGVMVSLQPPDLTYVSLTQAVNKIRTVPADSLFVQVARALGISLGD